HTVLRRTGEERRPEKCELLVVSVREELGHRRETLCPRTCRMGRRAFLRGTEVSLGRPWSRAPVVCTIDPMTNNMRVRIGAVVLGLAMVIGFVSPSGAGASHRDDRPGGYVALGDSVTFGYSPLLEDPWIPERFVGYAELIGQRTGMPVTNLG